MKQTTKNKTDTEEEDPLDTRTRKTKTKKTTRMLPTAMQMLPLPRLTNRNRKINPNRMANNSQEYKTRNPSKNKPNKTIRSKLWSNLGPWSEKSLASSLVFSRCSSFLL
uniref:Uncharacterized protein n=1 Tax=Cacopsylla melanoneura TaxID=428564 RepID=A0A8D8RXC5_9HEMI